MRYLTLAWVLCLTFAAAPASAQKSFTLAADPALVENGFAKYLLPRFSLKAGIRINLSDDPAADALLGVFEAAPEGTALHPVLAPKEGGDAIALAVREDGAMEHTAKFLDWLRSDVGKRTIEKFKIDGEAVYAAVKVEDTADTTEEITGDIVLGEKMAFSRCARCHVINEKNRYGGIGSTPSFGAMKTLPRWRQRFEAFWTLNPHPAFTQIEGVTPPFDPARPSPIAPIELTLDELDALLAFIMTIKVKDLGAPLEVK